MANDTAAPLTLDGVHPDRLYSTVQAAQALELHPDTVYKIPRALLPRTPVGPRGGRTKIRGRDLLAYVDRMRRS